MKKRKLWLILSSLCVGIGIIAYPFPDSPYLHRNIPSLQGNTQQLKGDAVAFFSDPSLFYRFQADRETILRTVAELKLEPVKDNWRDYYQDTVLAQNRPFAWNSWWWKPQIAEQDWLYEGGVNGKDIILLYSPETRTTYIYIQNT